MTRATQMEHKLTLRIEYTNLLNAFLCFISPPWKRPHYWLKHVDNHYAVTLHPQIQTSVGLLIIYKSLRVSPQYLHMRSAVVKVKVKVKITLKQVTMTQRGSRGIALLFL